ncbi:TPA: SatD family protein [Streptococcus pyogenes]|nr:SatD family protein [Streptococcus pyogenes]
MTYIALIGDIIQSKQLTDRSKVQKTLAAYLDDLNKTFAPYIISKLSLTLGDEFQGLFQVDTPIFHLIDLINHHMDIPIRFGVGVGSILTDINPDISIGADGPAYWHAREAIRYIHQKNDYGNTTLALRTGHHNQDDVLNSLLAAGDAIKANWRASQWEIFDTLLDFGIYEEYFDQQRLGKQLSLSSSALSKRLKSSHVKIYLRTRQSALNCLKQIKEEADD